MKAPQQYPSQIEVQTPYGTKSLTWKEFCSQISVNKARAVLKQWEQAEAKSPLTGSTVMFSHIGRTTTEYWVVADIQYKDSLVNPKTDRQKAMEASWGRLRKALSYKLF